MPLVYALAGAPGESRKASRFVLLALALGVGSASVIVGLEESVFAKSIPQELVLGHAGHSGLGLVWRGAVASLYGGFTEEIILRLFGNRKVEARGRGVSSAGLIRMPPDSGSK